MDSNTQRAFAPHVSKVLGATPGLKKRAHFVRKGRGSKGIHNATEGFTVEQHELVCTVEYRLRMWDTTHTDCAQRRLHEAHSRIITTLEQAGYTVIINGLCHFTISK
jgi:hypothetical protein